MNLKWMGNIGFYILGSVNLENKTPSQQNGFIQEQDSCDKPQASLVIKGEELLVFREKGDFGRGCFEGKPIERK